MKQLFTALCTLLLPSGLLAQYAPQAGVAGSTAISAGSPQLVGWATKCQLVRGLQQIGNPGGGYASAGDSANAIGPANGSIVSLGDSGVAVLTFARPIINGPGPDFAVFENGFGNPVNAEEAFLELAFVEVSSDGVNYVRFPAASLTPDSVQVPGAGVYLNARLLNNLAGKYVSGYGTPFDLQELAGKPGLDVNHITHVRLVDVIGSVGSGGSLDADGRKINDPFPTPFPSSGLDLDAVGVLHQESTAVASLGKASGVNVFPNPVTDQLTIQSKVGQSLHLQLTDITGQVLWQQQLSTEKTHLSFQSWPAGLYYLTIRSENGTLWVEKIFRQ